MNSLSISKRTTFVIFAAAAVLVVISYALIQIALPSRSIAIDITEGFENNISNNDYVFHGNNARFQHINNSSEAHRGNRALKIESSNSGQGISGMTRWMTGIDKHTVSPGEQLSASVYLRAQNVQRRGVLAISYFKEKGSGSWGDAWISTAVSSGEVRGTSDWTRVSIGSEVPREAVYARFEFRLMGPGTMWIDSFTVRDTGMDIDLGGSGNDKLRVYETPSKTGDEFGAQVVLDNKHFIWVNAACKKKLVEDGNIVSTKTWKELDSEFQQLRTNSLDCSQVRTFTEYQEAQTQVEEAEPGPAEIISAEEPEMSNPETLNYTNIRQYDTSVIPEDDVVVTTLHGRFRGPGQQIFTLDCKSSHFRNDDPIVFPGQSGASHQHEFFGDRSLSAHSTIESIIGNSNNTCEVGGDRSAYWTPTVYQDGRRVRGDNNKFYYRVGQVNPRDIVPMPVGLRIIAGNANAIRPQSPQVTYFFATPGQGKVTQPKSKTTHGGQMFTIDETENGVRGLITFPQCWDGEHLWLPNSAHMAYARQGSCPASHPNAFFQLQMSIGYSDATGGEGFRLSSGPWYTYHADFINGWRPETLKRLVDTCIKEQRYCGMTKSEPHARSCASRGNALERMGCIEFRRGEANPRFFGVNYD